MALLTEHAEQDTLGGGRYRQTIALKRIAYRRDGSLRRITNALGNSGDPALSVGVDELAQFRVADRLAGQRPVIHFGKGASNVRLTPLATNAVDAVVAGNVVTYPGAWDHVDLRLSIGGHILRKEILLRAGHPSTFSFRIANHAGLNIDTLATPDFRILQPSLEGPNGEHIPLLWAVSSSGGKYILTCTLPPGNYAGWVVDPTLVLQPDGTDGVDTHIHLGVPDANRDGLNLPIGENDTVGGYVQRTLIKSDFSSIPSNAGITTTTLSLFCFLDRSSNARTFRVYRQLRAWVETQATWNIYSTGNSWQTAGGFGALDCEQTDIGSRDFTDTEILDEFKDFVLTPASVQEWVDGTLTNNGVLLKADTEVDDMYAFYDSDDVTPANRPKLTVVYTLPATGMSRAPIASWCH